MSGEGGSKQPFAAVLLGCGALMLLGAVLYADASAHAGHALLSRLTAPVERALGWGSALSTRGAELLAALRLPLLVGLGALLAAALRRGALRGGATQLLAALLFAGIAQSYLMDDRAAAGLALYALAALLYLWRRPAVHAKPEPAGGFAARAELPALLLLFALYLLGRLYLLDIHPNARLDEVAYIGAAGMTAGLIEPGPILLPPLEKFYLLERFQAQPIPLHLHALALSLLTRGLLTPRLVSVAACGLALLIAVLALRNRIGRGPTAWMLALCAISPFCLFASRMGLYQALSVLHGTLCFAALVHLHDRPSRPAALLLGALLAVSLYLYQLSWFLPLVALAAFALLPELRRRDRLGTTLLPTALAALLVALPVFSLPQRGLRQLVRQTFDKTALISETPEPLQRKKTPHGLLIGRETANARAYELEQELAARGFEVARYAGAGGQRLLMAWGSPSEFEKAMAGVNPREARRLADGGEATLQENLGRALSQLVYAPSWGMGIFQVVDGPVLNPVVTPLVLLGLLEAIRRRRQPAVRALLVWVVLGGLLPPLVTNVYPRRALLMLPYVHALAGLSVHAIASALWRRGAAGRWAAGLASGLFFVAAGLVAGNAYFYRFNVELTAVKAFPEARGGEAIHRVPPERRLTRANLARVLKGLPVDRPIFMPPIVPTALFYLERVEGMPTAGDAQRIFETLAAQTEAGARRFSCRKTPPFVWLAPDREAYTAPLAALQRDHVVRSELRGDFRVFLVESRRPGGCRG